MLYDLLGEYALEINGMNAKKLSILYKICDHLIHSFMLSDNQPLSESSEERLDPVFRILQSTFLNRFRFRLFPNRSILLLLPYLVCLKKYRHYICAVRYKSPPSARCF